MMPIDPGWISLSILAMGRGRRPAAGAPNSQRTCGHAQPGAARSVADMRRVQFQAAQHEGGIGVAGRAGQREQGFEAGLQCLVRQRQAVTPGDRRQPLPGQGALEQAQEVGRIGQFGGGVDRGAVLPEVAFVQIGIQPAHAGADDHAEFAGVVQADAQIDRRRRRGPLRLRAEADAQCRQQGVQLRLVQGVAPRCGGLAEQAGRQCGRGR